MKSNQFIVSVLVNNQFGVLTRVSGLFARRGYNIDSLNVGETDDPSTSRMTIIASGDDYIKEQIVRQLEKLQDVKCVELLENDKTVIREHMLVKIKYSDKQAIDNGLTIFRAKVVDFSTESIIVEVLGDTSKLDAFIEFAAQFGILEICRAGALALNRGLKSLNK